MSDVVVTVPKGLWREWIEEGDAVGERETGEDCHFYLGGNEPSCSPGDRVYVVCWFRVRGYAPLVRIEPTQKGYALVRRGGAVAVTIPESVQGFRGWRYRWWERSIEVPFPDWQTAGYGEASRASVAAPPDAGAHHCHATGCQTRTAPRLLMCRKHWFMVPKPLRDEVWESYRPGQEIDKRPSREWQAAADAAIRAVEIQERMNQVNQRQRRLGIA